MDFKEVSRDTGNSPRFILKEEVGAALILERKYSVGGSYSCHYELTYNLAGTNQRDLEFAFGKEFKFFENKSSLLINKNENGKVKGNLAFRVIFSPHTEGDKDFQLVIKGTARQGSLPILDRRLNVRTVESLRVTGHVENKLPIQMQLGEDHNVTFVFENKANREIKDFKIIIKEEQEN